MIVRWLEKLTHALLAMWIVGLFYFGPFLGAVITLRVADELDIEAPERPAVEYLASMSMIPFPDPSAEVLETTKELMEPPKKPKSEAKPEETGAPAEVEDSPGGTPVPKAKSEPKTASGDREGDEEPAERSGGLVEGPTQDGTGRKKQECLEPNPDIQQVSATRFRLKEEIVDYYVNHLNEADKLATVYWNKGPDGEIDGFRIRRVRCGNDLYTAGFRGGDVVLAVNGESITSVPQAIKAYLKLRTKKKLTIKIRRRKEELELTYVLT